MGLLPTATRAVVGSSPSQIPTAASRAGPMTLRKVPEAGPMTLRKTGSRPRTGGPIILRLGWPHDPAKNADWWPHETANWHPPLRLLVAPRAMIRSIGG